VVMCGINRASVDLLRRHDVWKSEEKLVGRGHIPVSTSSAK
jgi:hypothetical protein